jgi:hypothetical protein
MFIMFHLLCLETFISLAQSKTVGDGLFIFPLRRLSPDKQPLMVSHRSSWCLLVMVELVSLCTQRQRIKYGLEIE